MYPADLRYTNDHEWARKESDGTLTVGITDWAAKQLGEVVFVEMPEVGAPLEFGEAFGTIESVKAVSELYAPVSGTIVEVNAALKEKPEAVNSAPHDSWMVAIKLSDPGEVGTLLDVAQYTDLVK